MTTVVRIVQTLLFVGVFNCADSTGSKNKPIGECISTILLINI